MKEIQKKKERHKERKKKVFQVKIIQAFQLCQGTIKLKLNFNRILLTPNFSVYIQCTPKYRITNFHCHYVTYIYYIYSSSEKCRTKKKKEIIFHWIWGTADAEY